MTDQAPKDSPNMGNNDKAKPAQNKQARTEGVKGGVQKSRDQN